MTKLFPLALAATACAIPAAASAQTAPDGTRAFGIEPYVGVSGVYENFDRFPDAGSKIRPRANGDRIEGTSVEGVVGVNVPLGPIFVGAEGNVSKGVSGDFDWQYGVVGRAGLRVGDSGMFYGRAGYQWINFDGSENNGDIGNEIYGVGFEVGPKDIGLGGITGQAGVRLKAEMNTYDFESLRPSLGVVFHF